MDDARALAGRLAEWIVDYASMGATLGDQVAEVERGLRHDFPEIDRLAAPVEGVELTRYGLVRHDHFEAMIEPVKNGAFVRYDDAASAIAAKVDDRVRLTAALTAKEAERVAEKERADKIEAMFADRLAAPEGVGHAPFRFRRYINGEERAEGVTIEKEPTLEAAMAKAVRIASRRPGEALVLVLEPAAPAPEGVGLTRYAIRPTTFHDSAAYEAIDRPEGEWVRHEDAAARIADLEARLAEAERINIAAEQRLKDEIVVERRASHRSELAASAAERALADATKRIEALAAGLVDADRDRTYWHRKWRALSPASEGKTDG